MKKVPSLDEISKKLQGDLKRHGFNKKATEKDMDQARGISYKDDSSSGQPSADPKRQISALNDLLKGIIPKNVHGETDWGEDRGKETVRD